MSRNSASGVTPCLRIFASCTVLSSKLYLVSSLQQINLLRVDDRLMEVGNWQHKVTAYLLTQRGREESVSEKDEWAKKTSGKMKL